tara:strand:+ start:307 stop:1089 length:783 start_codon:yes stop_codon:yes gene_type:complete
MLAPSPCLLRVLTVLGDVAFEYDVGLGAVSFVHPVGAGLITQGVVAGNLAADDLLTALQIDLAGQDPLLAGNTVTLDPVTWRVVIDVGAGNTLSVLGASAATTFDLHRFGFDQGVNTAALQVTTAPQAPLGTWASPVPLGGGYLRRRQAQASQPVAVSGRVVTVRRGVHLSTSLEFTDVPEASVFHSGASLSPTVHDAEAFERFYEDITDGAAWHYCLDRSTRIKQNVWVYDADDDFAPDRRIDGWPYFSFGFSAREFVS